MFGLGCSLEHEIAVNNLEYVCNILCQVFHVLSYVFRQELINELSDVLVCLRTLVYRTPQKCKNASIIDEKSIVHVMNYILVLIGKV